MQSFSNVSVMRVAGGYLLMVRTVQSWIQLIMARDALTTVQLLISYAIPAAGLCLFDHAKVGLCQVPGSCGASRGAVDGSVGGCRTGSLLPARPLPQCCNYPGTILFLCISVDRIWTIFSCTIAEVHSDHVSSSGITLSGIRDRRGRHVSVGSLLQRDWKWHPRRGTFLPPIISSAFLALLTSSEW